MGAPQRSQKPPARLLDQQPPTFNPGTCATDILLRQHDSSLLTNVISYTYSYPAPAFHVANHTIIYLTAVGSLHILNTTITLTVYVFTDDDLAHNLFGLTPLLNYGCTTTFTKNSCAITGPPTSRYPILSLSSSPFANSWKFSLPKPSQPNETHAEIVLYASAVFGNSTVKTFSKALPLGWFSNYPDLTLKMLTANKLHVPATGLDHIAASRANFCSTRTLPRPTRPSLYRPKLQLRTQPAPTATNDDFTSSSSYSEVSHPHTALRAQTRSSLRSTILLLYYISLLHCKTSLFRSPTPTTQLTHQTP
jgi:hypothetical protein